jgi:DNA-binding MarR family transcriptional regulator
MPVSATADGTDLAVFAAALDDFLHAVRRARGRLSAAGELSVSQYHLLEPLQAADAPLGVGELAAAAEVSAPTATRMLATLERDALVERRGCPHDRRIVHVALTAEGRRRLKSKRESIADRRAAVFASLTADERRQAARLLERLAAATEELR